MDEFSKNVPGTLPYKLKNWKQQILRHRYNKKAPIRAQTKCVIMQVWDKEIRDIEWKIDNMCLKIFTSMRLWENCTSAACFGAYVL